MSAAPPFLDAGAIARALPPAAAVDALGRALRGGLDPDADPPRLSLQRGDGALLVMPSSAAGGLGVKLASAAPANPARGLPLVQGIYALFDPATLAPAALLDGIALTNLRTSAVSALAVRHLARLEAGRLLVFGTGAQGWAHVEAVRAVRPIERVEVVGRDRGRLEAFVARCRETGVEASAAGPEAAVARADVICCCTTARAPLFEGDAVAAGATVVAVGTHARDAREVDERLAGRATVVVESRAAALREAGDVVMAIETGALEASALVELGALVRGEATAAPDRPRFFKSVGMAWEDLVVARAVAERALSPRAPR